MAMDDTIKLPEVTKPNGEKLPADWYAVNGLDGIDATYRLEGNVITVVDDGVLATDDALDSMSQAPAHWNAKNQRFTGKLVLVDHPDIVLEFKENQLVTQ